VRLLLAAALLVTSCAAAEELAPAPPLKYDHHYTGHLSVKRRAPGPAMWWACGAYGAIACAIVESPTRCTIILPKGVSARVREAARRHETAHCAGWPADHPGARPASAPRVIKRLRSQ
jgi:hypothetical protein